MAKMKTSLLILFVILSFLLNGIPPVFAQEGNDEEFTLDEIIVTAEKREENVQKTSLSISVLTGDEIKEKSYTSIDSILQNVVGLQIQGAGGGGGSGARIFIRGIGLNNLDTAYGDPAIALNVDGIQQQRGIALSNSTMDVERVEVLRGPQGTMYGRNAAGGAVNVVMRQPQDKFEVSARVQYGNYSARTLEAMVNVPIYSKLALRLTGVKDDRDTYMHGPGATEGFQDQLTARAKALFKAFEDLTLTGTVEYREDRSQGGWGSIPAANLDADDPWYVAATTTTTAAAASFRGVGTGLVAFQPPGGGPPPGGGGSSSNWSESWNYSLNIVWNIMDLTTFTFIPAMSTNELHTQAVSGGAPPEPYPKSKQYTYEARFANVQGSKLIWTLGGYLWDSSTSNAEQEFMVPQSDGWQIQQGDRPTGSWALFGQATYPVTARLRAIGGFRYNYDNKKQEYRVLYIDVADNGEDYTIPFDTGIVSYGETVSKPTFKFGMEYDLAENSMAYFTAANGYKSGGVTFAYNMFDFDPSGTDYSLVDLDPYKFDEETTMSYEIGSKNRFFNNRLQVNGSIFLTAYEGMQVMMWKKLNEDEDPIMVIANGGKTNTYGAELETTWLITGRDRVNISLATLHGKYNDIVIEYDSPSWAGGADNPPVDLDGVDMANMPRLNLQMGYTRTFNVADYGTLSATVDTNYKTEYYNGIETNLAGARVPSHHLSNFYMSWASPKGIFSASANVKNIENKAVAMAAMGGNVMLNSPRTYSASLTVKF